MSYAQRQAREHELRRIALRRKAANRSKRLGYFAAKNWTRRLRVFDGDRDYPRQGPGAA